MNKKQQQGINKSFFEKMMMNGVVLCKCGGQLISNSGKIYCNWKKKILHCWNCKKEYDINFVYSKRKENKTVVLKIET